VIVDEQAKWAEERTRQAWKNSAHQRTLLSEREPGFLATLRSAECQVAVELARGAGVMAAVPVLGSYGR